MSSSKVNFPLSPNLRLARRGSATPVECTEKKSPLRRGSWSPNLRLLRRSSDSNAVKDSQSLVRTSVFIRPSFVPFCFVTNARALSMETLLFWLCLFKLLQSQFLFLFFSFLKAKLASYNPVFTNSSTVSFGMCFVSSESLFYFPFEFHADKIFLLFNGRK